MKKRHTLTPDQELKRAARKAAQKELFARLAKMDAIERANLAAQMPVVTCEGRTLSVANMCLIALQLPHATVVGGFRQWIAAGRCVKKGEHGLSIRVPGGVRKESDAPAEPGESVFFIAGTVFDVSQTCELEDKDTAEEANDWIAPQNAQHFREPNEEQTADLFSLTA